jgi:hypothetical protein
VNVKVAISILGVVVFLNYVTAAEAQLAQSQNLNAAAHYELNKQIETDRQRTAFYNGLPELEQMLANRNMPIGTREHAEAYAAYDQILKLHLAVHDDQAALEERMEKYGYTKEQFLNPLKVERGTFDNGKFKGSDAGNVVKITAGSDTQGNPVVRMMSVPEFNEFKTAFMPKEVTDKQLLPILPDKQSKPSVRPQP